MQVLHFYAYFSFFYLFIFSLSLFNFKPIILHSFKIVQHHIDIVIELYFYGVKNVL